MTEQNVVTKPAAETGGVEPMRGVACYRPNVDIVEKADELLVMADIPGASSDKVDVNFEDGTLSIHAQVPSRQDPDQTEFLLREYGVGDYYRTFQVSETIDASRISAEFSDGVLTLHLPKAESAKPRKISVRSA